MERLTNIKLADIHLIYGLEEGNVRPAKRLFCEMYLQRDEPNHRMFTNLHHNLGDYGSIPGNKHSEGEPRVTRSPNILLIFFRAYPTHCVPCMEQNVSDIVQYTILSDTVSVTHYSYYFVMIHIPVKCDAN
ncbi:DUF4817 domain-containing protein [Trichonephila clavipes]|nr:DUF4817 domain-containing protein [Trichonephila clavipes]